MVCWVEPNASGVQRWEVSTLILPPWSTPSALGVPPGALRDIHHAGQDALGQAGRDDQLASLIPHMHQVSIADTSCGCIHGIDEDPLRESLLQPVIVGMRGMDPCQAVMPDGLQRIFFDLSSFDCGDSVASLETDFPIRGCIWELPGFRPVCPSRTGSWKRSRFYRWGSVKGYFCGISAEIGKRNCRLYDRF